MDRLKNLLPISAVVGGVAVVGITAGIVAGLTYAFVVRSHLTGCVVGAFSIWLVVRQINTRHTTPPPD